MAWKDTLLDASFRGVPFHVTSTDDHAERSQVRHEYPYRDGAEVEDLGRRARESRIQAFVWGDKYEDDLKKLLEALDKPGPGELIHPVFGSINVSVMRYSVRHDEDNPDSARIHLDFVEASPDAPFFGVAATATGKALARKGWLWTALEKLRKLNLSAVVYVAGHMAKTLSMIARGDYLGVARSVLGNAASAMGTTLPALPNFLSQGQALYLAAESIVASVETMAGGSSFGRFDALSWVSNLIPRFGLSGGSTSYSMTPAAYSGTPVGGPLSGDPAARPWLTLPAADSAEGSATPDLSTAAGWGQAMSAASLNMASAMAVARASAGTLAAEAADPTLTPAQVEAVVGVARQRIQDVIDETRALYPTQIAYPMVEELRTAALQVQEMGAEVIRLHPPVVAETVTAPGNLHLIAHRLYGDYTRAAELLRLNPGLRNPNFVAPGQVLNVYTK